MGRRVRSKRVKNKTRNKQVRINRFKSTHFKRNRIKSNRIKSNSIKKRNTSKKSRKSFKKIKNTSNRLFLGGSAPAGTVQLHKEELDKTQIEINKEAKEQGEAIAQSSIDNFDPNTATDQEALDAIDAALNKH